MKSQTLTIKQEGFKDLSNGDSKYKYLLAGVDMSSEDVITNLLVKVLDQSRATTLSVSELASDMKHNTAMMATLIKGQKENESEISTVKTSFELLKQKCEDCDIKSVKQDINELNTFKSNHEQQERDADKIFKIAGFSIQQFFVVISLVIGFIGLLIAFFKK